ncbi:MAG: hypothetical protein OEN55_14505 [Alphaproteobacteria bacterium]|nr:hypothetical protein [Alphaproteobacteria bacterium]
MPQAGAGAADPRATFGAASALETSRLPQPEQRVVTGAIRDLPALAKQAGLGPPSLIIIGSVVTLRGDLAWYEAAEEAEEAEVG